MEGILVDFTNGSKETGPSLQAHCAKNLFESRQNHSSLPAVNILWWREGEDSSPPPNHILLHLPSEETLTDGAEKLTEAKGQCGWPWMGVSGHAQLVKEHWKWTAKGKCKMQ